VRQPAVLFAILFAASAASGQWLETTIRLPDSLAGLVSPRRFAYVSASNAVYVGGAGYGCVLVIDGATNQKVKRIQAGLDIWDLCCNPNNNKVYCAANANNTLTVIDGATHEVITNLTVPEFPLALCS
jgi:YVTN family beta-propeller protein